MDAGCNDAFEYESYRFCAAEHGGTHLDAPRHFARGQYSAHNRELENLVGELFLDDVAGEASVDQDLLITIDHLKRAEEYNNRSMDGSIVLLYTGRTPPTRVSSIFLVSILQLQSGLWITGALSRLGSITTASR